LRTEDHRARSQRNAQITTLESGRRELIAALVKIDAEIADLRSRVSPPTAKIATQERRRRELIAALVKIDAEIADLHARPTPLSLVFDGGVVDDAAFEEDFVFADPGDRPRDEMS
jgi:chromosome segregation ATPase